MLSPKRLHATLGESLTAFQTLLFLLVEPTEDLWYNKYTGGNTKRSTERLQVRGGTESFISHIRETQTTEGTVLKHPTGGIQ